jgi:hypothetical protein
LIYLVAVNEQTLKHSDIFSISSLVKISITCMTFSIYTFFAWDYILIINRTLHGGAKI